MIKKRDILNRPVRYIAGGLPWLLRFFSLSGGRDRKVAGAGPDNGDSGYEGGGSILSSQGNAGSG